MKKCNVILWGSLCCSAFLLANAAAALRLPDTAADNQPVVAQKVSPVRTLASYSSLIQKNPFAIISQQALKKASLPKVSKTFRLVGTIAAQGGQSGMAIIEKKGGEQGVFSKGDTAFGANVVEIRHRAVVLRRNNRLEILAMDDDSSPLLVKQVENNTQPAVVQNASLSGSIIRSEVMDIVRSPKKLARELVLLPGKRGGESGLLIRNMRQNGLLAKSGLQRGDLLLAANGEPFTMRNGASNLRALLKEQQISIDLLRGNTKTKLELAVY